jgi:uncharacterized integral membrane protein (TIGR00697 family)
MIFWLYWLLGLIVSVYLSIWIIRKDRDLGYTFLVVLSAGYILIANILVPRLINIDLGFGGLTIVTGSLIWPFTAQLSDMINEVYGKRKTIYAFGLAYFINLLFVLFVLMANETTPIWSSQEELFWKSYFIPSGRVLLASTSSFIICQLIDIYVYSFFKEFRVKEDNTNLSGIAFLGSIRSITSDVLNMIFDGLIFSVLAFIFVLPIDTLLSLILSSILFKATLSVLDTPLYILFRIKIRKELREK